MTQTITTPVTHKFNSFEVLRDSALPLRTKVAITLTNNDVIAFDLVHKHAYGATNIFVIADCYGEHYMNHMLTNKGGYNEQEQRAPSKICSVEYMAAAKLQKGFLRRRSKNQTPSGSRLHDHRHKHYFSSVRIQSLQDFRYK